MWQRFAHAHAPAMVTVYSNKDGYTKDNVRVDEDGYVVQYDKGRTMPDLHGVEIGYALMSKSIVEEHCGGKLTVSNNLLGAVFKIVLIGA